MYKGNGLTVIELKKILKECPDYDLTGEPTEIWIETGEMLSSPVIYVTMLNFRKDGGVEAFDVLLKSNAFAS